MGATLLSSQQLGALLCLPQVSNAHIYWLYLMCSRGGLKQSILRVMSNVPQFPYSHLLGMENDP